MHTAGVTALLSAFSILASVPETRPATPVPGQQPAAQQATTGELRPAIEDDIDAFMEKVLERREINWDGLYDYVFSEVESLRIKSTEIAALQSLDLEYTWYVKEGYLVRSPFKVNGVDVSEEERESAEAEWIRDVDEDEEGARIVRDSFFDFEFEPGNYLFAGYESFEGHEVARIEYYPQELFDIEADEDEEFDEEELEHMFEKTSLVTMLVLPEEHQIVKWTFENVGLDFLPYKWLVRLEGIEASMIMDRPIEGIWLPREIHVAAAASTASFSLEVEYTRGFFDYRQTEVGARVVFGRPKR